MAYREVTVIEIEEESYAPVRGQLFGLLAAVNKRRKGGLVSISFRPMPSASAGESFGHLAQGRR